MLRGDLLPHLLAYKISSVSAKDSSISGMISHKMAADHELYQLTLCDFTESLKAGWHSVDTIEFLIELAQKKIWTVVLPSINQEVAVEIDRYSRSFNPYLGVAKVDTGNPIHIRLFSLMNGAYIHNKQLYVATQELADLYESYLKNKPILLAIEDFENKAPIALDESEISERGLLSVLRFQRKSEPTHSQKVAYALLDYLQNNPGVEVDYQVSSTNRNNDYICEENKVRNYLLNLEHPKGGPKAKFFIDTLAIQRGDWKYLADQISSAMNSAKIFRLKSNSHGITHGAFIEIEGRNGCRCIIQTSWIIESDSAPRLVTAYPHSDPVDHNFDEPLQNMSPLGLIGDAKYLDIYQRACIAGENAVRAYVPTPMVLKGYSPEFAGVCGFAWVTVADTRSGMAKWLKHNNIGSANYRAGWDVNANPEPDENDTWDVQSLDPKKAYAEAFAKVLTINGVKCKVTTMLD